jgi:hypothetical protein
MLREFAPVQAMRAAARPDYRWTVVPKYLKTDCISARWPDTGKPERAALMQHPRRENMSEREQTIRSEHVDHERDLRPEGSPLGGQPALPRRDVGEVRDPKLVWPRSIELAIDPIRRARGAGVGDGRANTLASHHATQTQSPHQLFNGAASHLECAPGSSACRPYRRRRPAYWPARHA